jgi:hypothetical protein
MKNILFKYESILFDQEIKMNKNKNKKKERKAFI